MPNPTAFASLFIAAVLATTALRIWLAKRQIAHVAAHRDQVPADFAARVSLPEHQKAADYAIAKARLGLVSLGAETALLLALTLGGVLQQLSDFCALAFALGSYAHGLSLFAGFAVLGFVVDLPFSLYRNFVLEVRFGFNRMTWQTYIADVIKGGLVGSVIGAPLLLAAFWLMDAMGSLWWLWVWLFWLAFNLLAQWLYPTLIAPLFNKFAPLDDDALRRRIEALLQRCGFALGGLFVMDGSKRSSHGNAYFTGFGRQKRIVFFDTLLARLSPAEVEAVLAHELGHFRRHHIWIRLAFMAIVSLILLRFLGAVMDQPWFYHGLGVASQSTAIALLLFVLVTPLFGFPLAPVFSALSRRHEFEADRYAAAQTQANDLISALVKLYRDNAATLTPDPIHSRFYDSHPPAALRIANLQTS